jgi:hypothetical protein
MKIPRHKLENNIINSVFDSGSNNIITKKICPKGPKLCSAKCMASFIHCYIMNYDTILVLKFASN